MRASEPAQTSTSGVEVVGDCAHDLWLLHEPFGHPVPPRRRLFDTLSSSSQILDNRCHVLGWLCASLS